MNHKRVQEYFLGKFPLAGEKILIIRRQSRLKQYAEYLQQVEFFGNVWHGLMGCYRGERIIILAGGIGASQIGDAVYALHKPESICIYAGTCGGLMPTIGIGDYAIAQNAIDGSGYGLLFSQAPFTAVESHSLVTGKIQQTFTQLQTPNHLGCIFSTGSVVREAACDFWAYVPKACTAIEMECAAFLTAAIHSHKRAGAFFWVTDLPTADKSFFDPLSDDELAIKQTRYDQTTQTNLTVLSNM